MLKIKLSHASFSEHYYAEIEDKWRSRFSSIKSALI